ncbi:MAG: hypothetical protein V4819_16405 [Verrucomicrobiota bacterium]
MANRERALRLINEAQSLLSKAAQLICPLKGFANPWKWIGDHMDKTQALWHRVHNAPYPTGHDGF